MFCKSFGYYAISTVWVIHNSKKLREILHHQICSGYNYCVKYLLIRPQIRILITMWVNILRVSILRYKITSIYVFYTNLHFRTKLLCRLLLLYKLFNSSHQIGFGSGDFKLLHSAKCLQFSDRSRGYPLCGAKVQFGNIFLISTIFQTIWLVHKPPIIAEV